MLIKHLSSIVGVDGEQMKRKKHGMKLGTKIAVYTFVFGAIVGVTLTLVFSLYTRNSILAQAKLALTEQAHQAAHFVDALLDSRVEVANSIAAAKTIEIAAEMSNAEFGGLSDAIRGTTIQELDARWQSTETICDPFIAQYLENDAAQALIRQMETHPGEFGEIFLTNRFGALIATTEKLTTLAHGHKPWWLAAYNEGLGAVFLDDRGYDDSVGDYVLGVVVPVMSAGEVIGILKCNYSILPAIEKAMITSDHASSAEILLARSNGLVVHGPGLLPLQSTISGELITLISETESGCAIVREGARTTLAAFWAVPWTVDLTTIASFGGTSESIDHSFGNSGESWVVVVSQDMAQILAPANLATVRIALIAAGFIVAMALIALILGWRIAEPASKLAAQAQALGSGNFGSRVSVKTTDEIGGLAQSLNVMADNLESTMVSRDKLSEEVARRELVEGALRESEKRFRTLFETSPLPINMTDSGGRLVLTNTAFQELLGYSATELKSMSFLDITHPEDRDADSKLFRTALADHLADYTIQKRYLHKSGKSIPVDLAVSVILSPTGEYQYGFAIARDLTQQQKYEEKLVILARHDPLTGVYNRHALEEILEQEVIRSRRYKHSIGLLMVDVNRFKEVNDRFGHAMGDQVLKDVAEILQHHIRDSDIVVRYGGDEFLVVLFETESETTAVVSRIRAEVAERNRTNPVLKFPVTLAIGEAHWDPEGPDTIDSKLSQADKLMYLDKARNQEA